MGVRVGHLSQDGVATRDPGRAPCRETPEVSSLARMLLDSAQPFGVATFDGRWLYANRAFESLIGWSTAELQEMSIDQITPEPWRSTTHEQTTAVRALGVSRRYEKAYRTRDGRIVPVEIAVDLWRDDSGEPRGYTAFITDITERKATEERLRQSEERFRRLFDEAPFGYHELALDGTILRVNSAVCAMLGYEPHELIGRSIFDFMAPESREQAREALAAGLAENDVRFVERTFRRRDGKELLLAVESRVNRDESGRVIGLRSSVRDVTAARATRSALAASERRLRLLYDGIDDVVFVHDADGRILDANAAACRKLGYTREELLKLSTADIDDTEFAAGFAERYHSQLHDGGLRCEGRHRTKDGRSIPVDINTSTVLIDGRPAILAVTRDITERKALEETRKALAESQARNAVVLETKNRELMRSEARYRLLTEGTLDAVVVADGAGRIVLFNPAAERTFGYTAAEILGRPLVELMPEDLRDDLITGLQDYLRGRPGGLVGNTVEIRGRRKDGVSFPLEISLSTVDVGGELQFLGAIRDLSERQRMRAMLMQSEKLASIGLLSAGVAHEINNPLAFVGNNLAVLERDLTGILDLIAAY